MKMTISFQIVFVGNTMPDLSDMVPFHPVQVENLYLLVCEQVQMSR